jgi:hypothetical protein
MLEVEHGEQGIRAFSIDPGYVVTEAAEARGTGAQFSAHFAVATPPVIGVAIAWLATSPEAEELRGQIVLAQRETKRRGLLPGWPPADWVNPEKQAKPA